MRNLKQCSTTPVEAITLAIRLQTLYEALQLLSSAKTDREAGRHALLLAHSLGLIGSQKELAEKMGLSQSRTSRLCKSFRVCFLAKSGISLTRGQL